MQAACWRVADFENVTGTAPGGISTDIAIVNIEIQAGCTVGVDDLNAVPAECESANYVVLHYARRTFLNYVLHYDNDSIPFGPETDETVVAFHDEDDITGAIHTNLTSVLVCGGATTFEDATVETGGISGSGSYANQCTSKTAPPAAKTPVNTGQLNVASFGTTPACDSGIGTGYEGLTAGRQWLRDAVRVIKGGVAGWVDITSSGGKVDLQDLITTTSGKSIDADTKVVYSQGDMLVTNSGNQKLSRPVTLIAGRDIIIDGSGGPIGTDDPATGTPPDVLAFITGCNLRLRYERNQSIPTPGVDIPEPDSVNGTEGWCLTWPSGSGATQAGLIIGPKSLPINQPKGVHNPPKSPVAPLASASGAYTVELATNPNDTVTVNIAAEADSDPKATFDTDPNTAGNQTSLTFDATNWNVAQTVTVTVAEDNDYNDSTAALKHTTSANSGDYINTRNVTDTVSVVIYDKDNTNRPPPSAPTTPDLIFDKATITLDEGSNDTYTVRLATRPSSTVTVTLALSSANTNASADIKISKSTSLSPQDTVTLTFNQTNWSSDQIITVTAQEDNTDSVDGANTIIHTAAGGDYAGVTGRRSRQRNRQR